MTGDRPKVALSIKVIITCIPPKRKMIIQEIRDTVFVQLFI